MQFAQFVLTKLGERNMKPSQLAHYSGVSAAEISRLLAGRRVPSLKTIKKLAEALRVTEEDLMKAAGYIKSFASPKTITMPIVGNCPAGKFDFAFEHVVDTLEINFDIVKDRKAFCVKVQGDCLRDIGIFDGDFVIVSPQAPINTGDIVVSRIGDECTMKKFHHADPYAILMPCNHHHSPIVLDPKKRDIQIVGKVIRAIRNL